MMRRLVLGIAAALAVSVSLLAIQTAPAQKPAASTASPSLPKPEELDRLLAPIALYPDALLGQMLLAAGNPGKVGTLNEWLRSHENLKGTELQDAAKAAGFDASFVAIALFPDVVNAMVTRMDATSAVGKAFAADPSVVFASVQRLRKKAQEAGKLKSTPQQDVETKTTSSGQQVIVIEPANPQIVYVPQYNPTTVYNPVPTSTTVVVKEEDNDAAVAAGLIGFTAGIAIGAAIDNDYYYGPYGWRGGMYMYDDAWDDWYDAREDAREDWHDNREDLAEERSDRAKNAQEQRTERTETRQENRPEAQAQRTERQQTRQENRPQTQAERDQRRTDAQSAVQQRGAGTTGTVSQESRGYSGDRSQAAARERSGTKSDAFSGYSSGRSERAASQRGQRSRSSSRGGRR
ncbi:MAG TPA: DUF3300 domain-containing protein [Vicinamibacterales bacterium]|nr:DUF3300 domain-containing protein [Vicinamibacterales bacterium]